MADPASLSGKRVLLYAANLHVGGGVQVASSIIEELSLIANYADQMSVLASVEVDFNVRSINVDTTRFASYEVKNHYGLSSLWSRLSISLSKFDGVLTVFGPLYVWSPTTVSVVGFAQPWIVYPNNEVFLKLPWIDRLFTRSKYWAQSRFFKQADVLTVELDHVMHGLIKAGIGCKENIKVVHNCISSIYGQPERWAQVHIPVERSSFKMGFLGRNYPHKNTKILPAIQHCLKHKYGMDVDFYVTFSDREWLDSSPEFRASIKNVGPLSVAQCPAFYKAMDGVIFPSLLECFSATPLEAMAMERPLFAADRPFIHDVCGEHAHYFDPTCPADAAACIADYLRQGEADLMLSAGREHALSFSNAQERARQLMACLADAIEQTPPPKRKTHFHALR